MPTLKVAKAVLTSSAPKLRVVKVVASGTGRAPTLRVARARVLGASNLSLQPFADRTVEALDVVTLTALPGATSSTPTGYEWRQVSGAATAFEDNGNSITFTAPPVVGGSTVVFGCIATIDSVRSNEVTASVKVLPHLYWIAGATAWIPQTRRKKAGE
jgi:hypothetical protein